MSTEPSLVLAHEGRIGTPEDQAQIQEIFSGPNKISLLPFVNTVPEFIAITVKLAHNKELRAQIGGAFKAYVERYACNETVFAETACRHLVDVISSKHSLPHELRGLQF